MLLPGSGSAASRRPTAGPSGERERVGTQTWGTEGGAYRLNTAESAGSFGSTTTRTMVRLALRRLHAGAAGVGAHRGLAGRIALRLQPHERALRGRGVPEPARPPRSVRCVVLRRAHGRVDAAQRGVDALHLTGGHRLRRARLVEHRRDARSVAFHRRQHPGRPARPCPLSARAGAAVTTATSMAKPILLIGPRRSAMPPRRASFNPTCYMGRGMSTTTGRYGDYGGRFVSETLVPALDELEARVRRRSCAAAAFQASWRELLAQLRRPPDAAHRARRASRARSIRAARPSRRCGSNARTSVTRARTRSTTPSVSACSRRRWARRASSPRPARASTASRRRPRARCSGCRARSTWARSTSRGRRRTSAACACSARR